MLYLQIPSCSPAPALEPLVGSLFYGTPSLSVLLLLAPWPYKVDPSHKRTVLSRALRVPCVQTHLSIFGCVMVFCS